MVVDKDTHHILPEEIIMNHEQFIIFDQSKNFHIYQEINRSVNMAANWILKKSG
jgi:hypothetical protein